MCTCRIFCATGAAAVCFKYYSAVAPCNGWISGMVDLPVMIVKRVCVVCSVCLMGVHVDSGNDDVCVECSLQKTAANVPFLDNVAQSREQYQSAVSHA
jgi:hypothetical protein